MELTLMLHLQIRISTYVNDAAFSNKVRHGTLDDVLRIKSSSF